MEDINDRVIAAAKKMGAKVYPRYQWGPIRGAVYAQRLREKPVRIKQADTLVQHITVTRPSGNFFTDCRVVEAIGWERFQSGVSYNWLVDMRTGEIAEGQPLHAKGTHTVNDKNVDGYSYDQNHAARSIAVIGMPETKLTDAAAEAISILIAAMISEGALTQTHDYKPHSFFAWKDCPCDSTRDRMGEINRAALKLLKPQPEKKHTRVSVATLNAGKKGQQTAPKIFKSIANQVAFLGVQEFFDQPKLYAAATKAGLKTIHDPDIDGSKSIPIFYDPANAKLLRSGTEKSSDWVPVEAEGAGGKNVGGVWKMPPKWINWGLFEVRGLKLLHINLHIVASVQHPLRADLARKQISHAVAIAEKHVADGVIITMDGNAPTDHPIFKELRAEGYESSNIQPTHGERRIDHVWTRSHVVASETRATGSDHAALLQIVKIVEGE